MTEPLGKEITVKHPGCLLAVTVLLFAGCIASHDVSHEEIDQWWALTDTEQRLVLPADNATPEDRELSVPRHWNIRHSDRVIGATVSLVRAMDAIDAGADRVEFALAKEHIEPLLKMLSDVRATMRDMNEMLGVSGEVDQAAWAGALAEALVTVEAVARQTSGEATGGEAGVGLAGRPMLDLLTSLIDTQSGQDLLAELDTGDVGRLRQSLVQIIVRMGFDIAGRQSTPEMATRAATTLRDADDLNAAQADLTEWLAEQLGGAAPAASSNREAVKAVLTYGPKGIMMFESFLSQWSRIRSMTVELASTTDGSQAAVLTVRVKAGQEIRIDHIMTGVPAIVLRGSSRVSVLPSGTPTGDAVVSFDPVADGAVELRFEGLLYGLVRLFAFPLDSGPLREIRLARHSRSRGDQLINIAVLMESSRDTDDPRRMLSVQDVRRKRVVRDVIETRTVVERSETVVNYITPAKRYTYQRMTREDRK
jgi:hypothetical protein